MDLTQLTPDQLSSLKQQLDALSGDGSRSPIRPRQLHDLRLLPTKDDPRPTFFWSADQPRDYVPGAPKPYPKLMWHRETGEEITVQTAVDERAHGDLYVTVAPTNAVAQTPMDWMREALEALSPEERTLVVEGQKQDRLTEIRNKLASLSPEALESLLSKSEGTTKRAKKVG